MRQQTYFVTVLVVFLFEASLSAQRLKDPGTERRQIKSATCQDGMQMVHRYLETSKVELIKNIRAAKMIQCSLQKWRKVDSSMVAHSHSKGVTASLGSDASGGLIVNAKVTSNGCGKGPGSSFLFHIKGKWQQIMYTQVFKGKASCWRIFGQDVPGKELNHKTGLEVYNPTMGDIIFGQKKMRSSSDDLFDGKTVRCDNKMDNFWHGNNGAGERQATVMLRRKVGAKHAGIYTYTSCGTPEYVIKDIFVLM